MATSLFLLPNGQPLKYAYPGDRGNQGQWFRTNDTLIARNWDKPKKHHQIKLGLWSSNSNQSLVSADFDHLPEGCSSFDKLSVELSALYTNGIHFRSISGKCKVLFLVESDSPMTWASAIAFLKSVLRPNHFDSIDNKLPSLSITFLNPCITETISSKLPTAHVHKHVFKAPQGTGSNTTCTKILTLRRYNGDIPDKFTNFVGKNPKKEDFLRILLTTRALVEEGFDISSLFFSRQCNTTQQNISNWINQLIKYKQLLCINDKYIPNKRAKRYLATGILANVITKETAIRSKRLPKAIEDGKWHNTIWKVSRSLYRQPEEFMRWFKSIPNWDKKPDRVKHVEKAIKRRIYYEKKK